MPIKTGTFYHVTCKQCGWSDNIFVSNLVLPSFLDKLKLPSKCPKCKGKLKSVENKCIWQ
jgi:predicted nucleic-acid-binding Zn-ribbon protein